jgi:hypothetical protein
MLCGAVRSSDDAFPGRGDNFVLCGWEFTNDNVLNSGVEYNSSLVEIICGRLCSIIIDGQESRYSALI